MMMMMTTTTMIMRRTTTETNNNTNNKNKTTPNVVIKLVALLLQMLEIMSSKLGPETGYPEWGLSWFSLITPGKCDNSVSNYATITSFHVLSSS
jgi:hypothetical protein